MPSESETIGAGKYHSIVILCSFHVLHTRSFEQFEFRGSQSRFQNNFDNLLLYECLSTIFCKLGVLLSPCSELPISEKLLPVILMVIKNTINKQQLNIYAP